MTPGQIAVLAWELKDEQRPLTTILETLGLDRHPRVHRAGPETVHRYAECLDAWRALVQERGYRASLPERHRRPIGDRIAVPCALDGCDVVMQLPPWQAARQEYCSVGHAMEARSLEMTGATDETLRERNEKIMEALEDHPTSVVAEMFDLTPSMVRTIRRDYERQGAGV